MMTSSEKALFASLFDIATYYARGEKPPYNVEGALESARKLLTEGHWFEEEITPMASDEQVQLETENLSRQIEDVVRRVSEPAIQPEAPVDLPDGDRHLTMITSFEDIQKQATDDPLVVAAFLPEYKEALAIVYSQIPKQEWGTEKAQRLIFKVLDNLSR